MLQTFVDADKRGQLETGRKGSIWTGFSRMATITVIRTVMISILRIDLDLVERNIFIQSEHK